MLRSLFLLFPLVFGTAFALEKDNPSKEFSILFSGYVRGNYEPCG